MGFLSKLFGKEINSQVLSDQELIEGGACPNCWGRQDYDGQFMEAARDQTKSNINHDKTARKAFIAQFVETNVTGIRLKKDGDQQICPACNSRYKHVTSNAS